MTPRAQNASDLRRISDKARTRPWIARSQPEPYLPCQMAFLLGVICSRELDWGLDPFVQLPETAGVPPSLDLSAGSLVCFLTLNRLDTLLTRLNTNPGPAGNKCCSSLFYWEREAE